MVYQQKGDSIMEEKGFRARAIKIGNSMGFLVKKEHMELEKGKIYEFVEVIIRG